MRGCVTPQLAAASAYFQSLSLMVAAIRELVVPPNSIVLYRVLDEARTVQVLRVKHVAQQMTSARQTLQNLAKIGKLKAEP